MKSFLLLVLLLLLWCMSDEQLVFGEDVYGPNVYPTVMPQPMRYTRPQQQHKQQTASIVAKVVPGDMAVDMTEAQCCHAMIQRAVTRIRARLETGVQPGITLPYLRVRYPGARPASAHQFEAPSVNFAGLK